MTDQDQGVEEPSTEDKAFSIKDVSAVLKTVGEAGTELMPSEIRDRTGIDPAELKAMLFFLTRHGFLRPFVRLHGGEPEDHASYRLQDRGVAFVGASCSFDNPFEHGLDKIEALIEGRRGGAVTRKHYVEAWEAMTSATYADRERVRPTSSDRSSSA